MDTRLNLSDAFTSYYRSSRIFEQLTHTLKNVDPTIALLVLEGLYRIESQDMKKRQFMPCNGTDEKLKNFLRQWRCEAPLMDPYAKKCVPQILKCLSIFRALNVPLFIENFGQKKTLKDFSGDIEDIHIDKNTVLCCIGMSHGESSRRATLEVESRSMPAKGRRKKKSFDLNSSMKGCWYKVCLGQDVNYSNDSIRSSNITFIGNNSTKPKLTTLGELGISCLRQGEIIYCHHADNYTVCTGNKDVENSKQKKDNNKNNNKAYVILYAEDNVQNEECFQNLKKPTLAAFKKQQLFEYDVEVVVFVPEHNEYDNPSFWSHRNGNTVNKQEICNLQLAGGSTKCAEMDLIGAFTSPEGCRKLYAQLIDALVDVDRTLGLLALEGLYRLDKAVEQLHNNDIKQLNRKNKELGGLKKLLRKWVCNFPSGSSTNAWWRLRRCLILYKTLGVPMFADTLMKVEVRGLSDYTPDQLESINIDGETSIFHVTHRTHARYICEQKKLRGSNKRNVIKGTWFGLGEHSNNIYGSKCFKTELSLLGITGLYQGEIVYYLTERNVILYATDEIGADFEGLKKPTQAFVEKEAKFLPNTKCRSTPYVTVSIFIPSRFLPSGDNFWKVVSKENDVCHKHVCMKLRRGERPFCDELVDPFPDKRRIHQIPSNFPQTHNFQRPYYNGLLPTPKHFPQQFHHFHQPRYGVWQPNPCSFNHTQYPFPLNYQFGLNPNVNYNFMNHLMKLQMRFQ